MRNMRKSRLKKSITFIVAAIALFLTTGFISACPIAKQNTNAMPDTLLLQLSEKFLYSIKVEKPTRELEEQLAALDYKRLVSGLNNDNAIKAFWLNMYNAWFQVLAGREKLKNPEIFKSKSITIASKQFSLDDIEHGILRKFRWKFSKGYLPSFFPGKMIKQLAVEKIDYRIHFALNCGAKSCPPIAFYDFENIDKQLDLATKSFLSSETEIDTTKQTVSVTKIMDWFAADFGGKKGVRKIIKNTLGQNVEGFKIIYKPYDWEQLLHNFSD